MINERLLEKIKKLLSLASSDNENEASAAAALANKLLIKHNLSMADLSSPSSGIIHEYTNPKKTQRFEDILAIDILKSYFFVNVLTERRPSPNPEWRSVKFTIIGTPTNVAVANYVFSYIARTFASLTSAYKKSTKCSPKEAKSYMLGLSIGLSKKLKAAKVEVENETGLVVLSNDPRIQEYIDNEFGKISNASRLKMDVDFASKDAGVKDGEKINIHRGIHSSSSEEVQLKLKS